MRGLLRTTGSWDAAPVVASLPEWQDAKIVLLYKPLPGEADPRGLDLKFEISNLNRNPMVRPLQRAVLYPRVASLDPPTLEVAEATSWQVGAFDISEPVGDAVDPAAIDFALIPGLAFDRAGRRLGRGKGFYDRLLASLSPGCFTCGLCHDFQLIDRVPTEPHDRPLDAVARPSGVFRRRT